ncbi:metallophosphoesterase family protein, partial [Candidatus Latescibacterota bacterium]
VREFEKLDADFIGVYGNNDGERLGLKTMFEKFGSLHDPPYEFEHYGKRFMVMHEPYFLEESLARNDLDIIIYGHLHKIDIRSARPMVINPGESCSWLTGRSTVVLLDLDTMSAELVDVGK